MQKAASSSRDVDMVLLCLRSTPIDHAIPSPGELLWNRKLVGNLPVKCPNNSTPQKEKAATRLHQRQSYQKSHYDQHTRELPEIQEGQHVCVYDPDSSKWSPAVVTQRCVEPRSYAVQTPSGKSLRRNRRHLRTDKSETRLNSKTYAATPMMTSESNNSSIDCIPMEHTSPNTTNDRPSTNILHKTLNTHPGTQKVSRSGQKIFL